MADEFLRKNSLTKIEIREWEKSFSPEVQNNALKALEEGGVLYFPTLPFELSDHEKQFLSAKILDEKSKNISFNPVNDELKGTIFTGEDARLLKEMMARYATYSAQLLKNLFPHYESSYTFGKTSFRPIEVEGRKTSPRKDDTRLHIDAFPSNPTGEKRLLRLFTNVNPSGRPRVWRVGEPLLTTLEKFAPRVKGPIWGSSALLYALGITKGRRTAYDHYMLSIHDAMKEDINYQKNVSFEEIHFPPGSSWMTYTDQVSHAAMSGQHLFEQTLYIPVSGLKDPSTSPLKTLETLLNKPLI